MWHLCCFRCVVCGARYKTRPGLTYHYTHSHKDKEQQDQDPEDDEMMMVPASPKRGGSTPGDGGDASGHYKISNTKFFSM